MKLMDTLSENEGLSQKKDRLIKKAEAYYKFLRKGSFKHSQKHSQKNYDTMVEHTYNYTLSEFHNIVVPMGSNIPTLICDIIVKDTNDEVKPVSIWTIQGYLRRIFEKHDIEISIRDAYGDVEPRITINEEVTPEYTEYLENVKKKAIKAYKHFRKGKVLWHHDVYTYEFSEGFEPGGYGLIKDKKRYFFLYPDQLIIKGHGLYKKEHPDYPNGYIVKQDHLPFEQIQKLIGILFEKYGVSIRIKDHSIIDRQERDQINEETDVDVNKEEKIKKKGETYYKFLKKGKIMWHGLTYNYELSDEYDYRSTSMGMFGNEGLIPIMTPKAIKVTGHGSEDSEYKKVPSSAIVRYFHNVVFKKYGVVISFSNAEFIGGVSEGPEKLNEESDDDVKIKEKLHKKGETYYKFYKKGTFTQTYVNNDMVDIYSYELSDEHYVHTKNNKDIFINCGIQVEDTSGNKKLIRPHLVQSHLRNIFAKHNIEIYIQNFSGDINNVSPAKPMDW